MSNIRFPKVHIATSVANHILDIADGIDSKAREAMPDPVLPPVALESAALNEQIKTPPLPTELPAGSDGAVVNAALGGESLTTPALESALGVSQPPV